MRLSVTGANGFVGQAVRKRVSGESEISGRYIVRQARNSDDIIGPNLLDAKPTDWRDVLAGTDVLVHLAAALPWSNESGDILKRINVDGTVALASAAADAGVGRIVFASTLGVHGTTSGDTPFTPASPICPSGHYAQTKYNAELKLTAICQQHNIELVILRPPVVYGFGVGGKIGMLVDRVKNERRLPFGRILNNRRQMIGVDNLADAILTACTHPDAPGAAILPADAETISTGDFMTLLAQEYDVPLRHAPAPEAVFRLLKPAPIVGGIAERLIGNVEINDAHLTDALGWKPPHTLLDGIRKMARTQFHD